MTPSWAILLITSHVPNAWKPVHVTMIDWVCAINSVAASGDKTAYALLWERWLLSAPYLINTSMIMMMFENGFIQKLLFGVLFVRTKLSKPIKVTPSDRGTPWPVTCLNSVDVSPANKQIKTKYEVVINDFEATTDTGSWWSGKNSERPNM